MATAAPPAPASIESIQDARIKEKLQELRQTDNVTNIYYFVRIYVYFALVLGGTFWFYQIRVKMKVAYPVELCRQLQYPLSQP